MDLGYCVIDLDRTVRFVRQDLKDDWFLDPLLFEDRLNTSDIVWYFHSNIETNNGVYQPIKKLVANVPKKGATLRYSLETCFYDRVAYHAFGEILIEHFDAVIPRRVLSHRLDEISYRKGKPKSLFLPPIEQWTKFREFVRVDSANKTVLETDIQNYFESIRIADLKATLFQCLSEVDGSAKGKAKLRFCIESICRCVEVWSYNGVNGLPQNRDISSFLASIYLRPLDLFMLRGKFDYYRYVDDIRVICEDKYDARNILKQLINELRKIGLNVNGSKTKIIEPGQPGHPATTSNQFDLERIDSLLNSKKKPLVAMAFKEVRDGLLSAIREERVSDREFRFFVNRIGRLALCKDIAKPANFFKDITGAILDCIPEWPHISDQFYSYLVAVNLENSELKLLRNFQLDTKKAIYGWQNYLLWKVFAYYRFCDSELIQHAKNVVNTTSSHADKAGAILYLGCCGDKTSRDWIVEKFPNFDNFFLQRHALIAIQEVEYQTVKEKVQAHIKAESVGMFRTLSKFATPKYIEPPREIRYYDLIREVSFYV